MGGPCSLRILLRVVTGSARGPRVVGSLPVARPLGAAGSGSPPTVPTRQSPRSGREGGRQSWPPFHTPRPALPALTATDPVRVARVRAAPLSRRCRPVSAVPTDPACRLHGAPVRPPQTSVPGERQACTGAQGRAPGGGWDPDKATLRPAQSKTGEDSAWGGDLGTLQPAGNSWASRVPMEVTPQGRPIQRMPREYKPAPREPGRSPPATQGAWTVTPRHPGNLHGHPSPPWEPGRSPHHHPGSLDGLSHTRALEEEAPCVTHMGLLGTGTSP